MGSGPNIRGSKRPEAAPTGTSLSGSLRAFLLTRLLGRPLSGTTGGADTSAEGKTSYWDNTAVIMTIRGGNVDSGLTHWVGGLQGCITDNLPPKLALVWLCRDRYLVDIAVDCVA